MDFLSVELTIERSKFQPLHSRCSQEGLSTKDRFSFGLASLIFPGYRWLDERDADSGRGDAKICYLTFQRI